MKNISAVACHTVCLLCTHIIHHICTSCVRLVHKSLYANSMDMFIFIVHIRIFVPILHTDLPYYVYI